MIINELKIGCVVMAAGLSSRFGGNKLLQGYHDKTLAERALDAVPAGKLDKVVVVTRFPEVQAIAEVRGFTVVWNDRPEEGISLTIRLGLGSLYGMDAVLFMVCDQPGLTSGSVSSMIDYYCENPEHIVGMAFGGVRGNPCIFPSKYCRELMALTGDTGGSAVIRRYEKDVKLFEAADRSELKDVDFAIDLDG